MNKPSVRAIVYCILVVMGLLVFPLGVAGTALPVQTGTDTSVVRYAAPGGLTSGACDTWTNACELQTALNLVVSGEELWVKQGVYKPTTDTDRNATFQLKTGVALYGGFAGTETARVQRNWATNATVLSGDIDGNDLNTDGNLISEVYSDTLGSNSIHVVTGSGVDVTTVLDGFTITAGLADGTFGDGDGGGMLTFTGGPALANITFSGNLASHEGGGMANFNCNGLTLTNVTYTGNKSGFDGGGLYSNACQEMQVTNATFRNNIAVNDGGGMKNYASDPLINHVIFKENTARFGGGLMNGFNELGSPTLIDVVFFSNQASQGGGMFQYYFSSPMLIDVIFMGNYAVEWGGGIHNWNHSNPVLTNVTFAGNRVGAVGSAIYNGDHSSPLLQNIIAWNNSSGTPGPAIFNYEGYEPNFPVIRYSLVEGCNPGGAWNSACGVDGANNLPDADPLFVAPEPASSAPTTAGDYRLQDTSPAINMGDNTADLDGAGPGTATIGSFHTDLGGNPRFVRLLVDLGAYENQTFPCPAGGVMYVDQDAAGLQTGASWTNALTTLQDPLQVSEACEIWVAEGVYYPDVGGSQTDNDRNATFELKSGVALYGGFAGTETARNQRNWAANVTVLSGDIDGNDITDPTGVVTNTVNVIGANSYHVVTGSSVESSAILDGFTITAGVAYDANSIDPHNKGGGMYISNGSPTLVHVTFSGNQAGLGGGMYNVSGNDSAPILMNVTFSNNRGYDGGGMHNYNSDPELMDVNFSGNTGEYGGGMFNVFGSPTLTNVTFYGNSGFTTGGGVFENHSSAVLINVRFEGNSAGHGGGMSAWDSSPTLTNVTFRDNVADGSCGYCGFGGGLWNILSSPTLTNVTFSHNSASHSGGGMYNLDSINHTISNSILWGNTSEQILNAGSSHPVISYSLVQGGCPAGSLCDHLLDVDPRIVNAASGDLRLTRTSPAIDAGNNAAVPLDSVDLDGDGNTTEPLPYDLASMPRFIDTPDVPNTGSGTPPIVDLGAYERGLNQAPLAAGEGYSTNEDTPLVVAAPGLLANDSDQDGDPITAVQNSGPPHGLLALNPQGSFTYTPTLNYNGPDSFTYVASDGGLSSNIVTVSLTINPVNDPPVISEGASTPVTMDEDGAATIFSLTLHAVDVDGDALTWSISTPAVYGAASANGTGASKAIGYTPAANYNGTDSFEVRVSDGHGGLDSILVNVTITAVNDSPVLDKPADLTINEDAAQQTVNLTGIGDGDPELSQILAVTAISSAPGRVPNPAVTYTSPNTSGILKFTPVANANGDATITVTVTDNGSNVLPNVNTVSKQFVVHVTSVNDPPAGANKIVTALEDASYAFATTDFGFSDPNDSPANSFNRVKVTTLPALGTLKLNGIVVTTGQFVTVSDITASKLVFSPIANAKGAPYAGFTFQVEDDGGVANGGVNLDPTPDTLTINVTPVNDPPQALGDAYTVWQDIALNIASPGVLANDTDIDSSTLTAILDSGPAHGVLTLNPDGSFVYTPALNYYGTDSFTYHASDGSLASGIVTVNLTVLQVYKLYLPVVLQNPG